MALPPLFLDQKMCASQKKTTGFDYLNVSGLSSPVPLTLHSRGIRRPRRGHSLLALEYIIRWRVNIVIISDKARRFCFVSLTSLSFSSVPPRETARESALVKLVVKFDNIFEKKN